jgi:hypothetical protein
LGEDYPLYYNSNSHISEQVSFLMFDVIRKINQNTVS